MRRIGWVVLVGVLLTVVPAAAPAGAATDTYLRFDDITGESQHDCQDAVCSPDVISYSFSSTTGACAQNCTGWPTDPVTASLTFSITRLSANNPCKAKAGTGTLDLSWPLDAATPTASGSFTFKARDSKTLTFAGQLTTSTVSVLYPPQPIRGTIGFPPNPCVGGSTSATIVIGG